MKFYTHVLCISVDMAIIFFQNSEFLIAFETWKKFTRERKKNILPSLKGFACILEMPLYK